MLRTDSFESLKPATFVFGNVDVAFGIHSGANGIKELAREKKPGAVANRRHHLAGCVIQNIDFPLVLVDDIDELPVAAMVRYPVFSRMFDLSFVE